MTAIARILKDKASKAASIYDGLALFSILSISLAILLNEIIIAVFPFGLIAAYCIFAYPKKSFFAFFAILPFSIEVYFSNGLGTDLPAEPLILLLFGFGILHFIRAGISNKPFSVITSLILLHLVWIGFSSLFAENPLISFKFLLAKLWYVLPFYFLSQHILTEKKDVDKWIKWFLIGLSFSLIYVMGRHFTRGFSFDTIGWAVSPIYRNHVNYAALLTIALPLCGYKVYFSKYRFTYGLFFLFLLIAVYFSFTRAAMGTVAIMAISALLMRFRLLFYSGLFAFVFALGALVYMVEDNRYVHYAPNYETTVSHKKFDNLIEATYQLEDISTMERVHRWVAGFKMLQERPWTGFGPNNFYFNYKSYTNNSFQTYVSGNPDRSGIHNYYLMTAVEQGLVGLIILILLFFTAIYKAEKSFKKARGHQKALLLVSTIIVGNIMVLISINDLVEAVKVGPFLFLALGLINRVSTNLQATNLSK